MDIITKVAPATKCIAPANPGEEWRLIEDPRLEPRYYISNYGRVKNINSGCLLTTSSNLDGYATVYFCGKTHDCVGMLVHRLVALAFLGQPGENQTHVDHIDGDPLNNKSDNLRWVSPLENMRNPITRARVYKATQSHAKCRQHMIICDQFPDKLFTAKELAQLVGVSTRSIHDACAKVHPVRRGGDPASKIFYTMRYLPLENEEAVVVTLADAIEASKTRVYKSAQPVWCIEDELAFPSITCAAKLYRTSVANLLEHCAREAAGCGVIEQQGFKVLKHFKRISREDYLAWLEATTEIGGRP